MTKRSNLLLLIVSLVLALAATLLIVRELGKHNASAAAPATTPPQQVVVVTKAVPSRTLIDSADVQVQQVPAGAVETGVATQLSQVIGHYTATNWIVGQQVINGMYLSAANASIATTIPKGEVAFTIPDSATSGVDDLVLPGDTVDILDYGMTGQPAGSSVVLSDLGVIYVDKTQVAAGPDNLPASTSGGDTITVAVTPKQAQTLAKLVASGTLHILLHSSKP